MTDAQPLAAEELEAFRAINRDAGPACTMDFARRMLATIDALRAELDDANSALDQYPHAVGGTISERIANGMKAADDAVTACNVMLSKAHAELAAANADVAKYLSWVQEANSKAHRLSGECERLQAQLDAANAAGEKLACDLATVSGALDIVNAELDALKARPVRVKPLVFIKLADGYHKAALPIIGKVRVEPYYDGTFHVVWSVPGFCDAFLPGSFATEAEAIAAANAEYERRILSALDLGETQAQPAPVVPDGWRLVPVEPTERMMEAGDETIAGDGSAYGVWDDMLDKAPPAPLLTEAQAGAKALREVADKLGNGPYSIARLPILNEADRLEREGGK